ncbi:hypothetical protein [Tsukamurella paurometabola]|uniref:SnoaL-like domain-containing protein n=1 Tax=Tsukamurella paurometabola TaxID=2061 RepID=A0ABS5NDT9_TSUPA|nr:hypothetical protein [Tsukamurella paurometabola]MBS4102422.1 hypothetical protein [Tsukamurella paurometabola]
MSAVEDRLAATLAKHVRMWVNGGDETGAGTLFRCSCLEWEFTNTRGGPEGEGEVYEHHHRHLAAVIASSDDLAVIEPATVAYSFRRLDGSAVTSRLFDTEAEASAAMRQHPSHADLAVCRRVVGEWEAVDRGE